MALNINGTTGISGVDGSASAPALKGSDSNTGVSFASDTVNINTGGSTRVTVDSAGLTQFNGDVQLPSPGSNSALIWDKSEFTLEWEDNVKASWGNSKDLTIYHADGGNSYIEVSGGGPLVIKTGDYYIQNAGGTSTHLLINSSGHFGFGPHGIDPSGNGGITIRQTVVSGTNKGAVISNNTIDSGQGFQEFRNSGTQIGSIGKSGTTSTTYNTGSDYRLKENESPIIDGITRLKVLKPYRFNWKADASTKVDGFFAHEVTPAVPEAITGEKDAVDSNNDPIIQQIDQSKLVPLLTAALQEAIAKIEVLETKVAALEAA